MACVTLVYRKGGSIIRENERARKKNSGDPEGVQVPDVHLGSQPG